MSKSNNITPEHMNRPNAKSGWYIDVRNATVPIIKIKYVDDVEMGVDENEGLVFVHPSFLFESEEEAQRIRQLLMDFRDELLGRISRGLHNF